MRRLENAAASAEFATVAQHEATATVSTVRRMLSVIIVAIGLAVVAGCGSVRDRAHDDLVDQLVGEGGLPRPVADCVVDRFFAERTTEELKEFFEREGLTAAESAEFARLGEECTPVQATS